MAIILQKDRWLDFFRYMRARARGGHINELAASLSFTTTLSLVPMVTLAFSLFAVMPRFLKLRQSFQTWLSDNLIPGAIGDPIVMYLNQFALKAKGLTVLGSLGLLLGVLFTLLTVENAFNRIWGVTERRPFMKRLGMHLLAAIFGPILLAGSIYFSSLLLSAGHGLIGPLSHGVELLAALLPLVLSILSFMLAYKILPREQIPWVDAWWGAVFAATVFELAKFAFASFISNFPMYKTVYGAFAILPLFLVWIYLTWWVTLAGATLVANLPIVRAWSRGEGQLNLPLR